jgi:branched-chain amino acid transport system ATP-binding protein
MTGRTRGRVVVRVEDLHVSYGGADAVAGLTVEVSAGEVVTIVGINGAGKTSALRGIVGFARGEPGRVTRGVVSVSGRRIPPNSPQASVRAGIRMVPERDKVFSSLTVEENFLASSPKREGRGFISRGLELFPELGRRRRAKAGLLSGGEKQMLAVAIALAADPDLLLVDELSLGLAPAIVTRLMKDLRDRCLELNLALLLVEQNAVAAAAISDRMLAMQQGSIIAEEQLGPTKAAGPALHRLLSQLGGGVQDGAQLPSN